MAIFMTLLFTVALFCSGCATGQLKVVSDPAQAKVRVLEPSTGEGYDLGVTPLEVERPDPNLFLGDLILLEVTKEGYRTEKFWLPNLPKFNRLSNTEVHARLTVPPKALSQEAMKAAWDKAIEKLIDAQRMVGKRQYLLAEATIRESIEVVGEYPQALRLLGSVYFLRGDLKKSREIWDKLLQANPNDREAKRMRGLMRGRAE